MSHAGSVNYIDTKEMILRKGSIAAHDGELILIPINMRDGSVLARGKGTPEWNYSAPHGAGRLMSRTKARETLDLEAYRRRWKVSTRHRCRSVTHKFQHKSKAVPAGIAFFLV